MALSILRTNPRAWRKLRQRVLVRDSYACQLRLQACTEYATEVDHKLSRMLGGDDSMENLQASCRNCNLLKGAGFFEQQQPPDAGDRKIPPSIPLLSGDYTRKYEE